MTQWQTRKGLQSDLGFLLLKGKVLTTKDGKALICHTGLFSHRNTQWLPRTSIN